MIPQKKKKCHKNLKLPGFQVDWRQLLELNEVKEQCIQMREDYCKYIYIYIYIYLLRRERFAFVERDRARSGLCCLR